MTISFTQRILDLTERIAQELKQFVTPAHPGLAKAWASFGVEKGKLVIHAAFNVESVTRLATGQYRVIFSTPFPDTNYCWQAFARNTGSQSSMKIAAARAKAEAKTPEFVEMICTTVAGTLSDSTEINLTVYR